MQNGNAQITTVFEDTHSFGKNASELIGVRLVKCENDDTNTFFMLTKAYIDLHSDDLTPQVTDQIFRKPMEAMRAAINLWNQTVMENPVTDEAPEPEPMPDNVDEDEFPW